MTYKIFKTSIFAIACMLGVGLHAPAAQAQELPRDIQIDMLKVELSDALKNNQNKNALQVLEKLKGLDANLSGEMLYYEGSLWAKDRHWGKAKTLLNQYLSEVGKSGKNYTNAIKLLVQAKAEETAAAQRAAAAEKKAADAKAAKIAAAEQRRREIKTTRMKLLASVENNKYIVKDFIEGSEQSFSDRSSTNSNNDFQSYNNYRAWTDWVKINACSMEYKGGTKSYNMRAFNTKTTMEHIKGPETIKNHHVIFSLAAISGIEFNEKRRTIHTVSINGEPGFVKVISGDKGHVRKTVAPIYVSLNRKSNSRKENFKKAFLQLKIAAEINGCSKTP